MAILKLHRLPLFPLVIAREKLARGERAREVGGEPAVMDEIQGVQEYDALGETAEVGQHNFAARAMSRLLPEGGTVVDLGCGSGRLLARLAHGRPDARIIGFDLSEPMLETARSNLDREGIGNVELRLGDITSFSGNLGESPDLVSTNFALHHLPDEGALRRCFDDMARVRASSGCGIWIHDFARLRHPGSWPAIASMANWPGPVVFSDAIESERAAFSETEMVAQLEAAGLPDLEHLRSRPLGEQQVHWVAGRGRPHPVTGIWQERALPEGTRLLAEVATRAYPRALSRV